MKRLNMYRGNGLIKEDVFEGGRVSIKKSIVFVGQAPSRDSNPKRALSGNSGARIAAMLDLSLANFLSDFARENLNYIWPGKHGHDKGDFFDFAEGDANAQILMRKYFTHYVILGAAAASCFKIPWQPLYVYERGDKSFFMLPHPSGINTWYNKRENKTSAAIKLKEFVYGK
jgi:uracil-DNA glycosylase